MAFWQDMCLIFGNRNEWRAAWRQHRMWNSLPTQLYTAEQVRQLDQLAIERAPIEPYALMQRAGQAAWDAAQQRWPTANSVNVFCGVGNNAGDGYVVARLARAAGKDVRVTALADPASLSGAAKQAVDDWHAAGGISEQFDASRAPDSDDLVVDALLGTGASRNVEGAWREAVCWMNERHGQAVLALDIPSGLCANTGAVFGDAVRAELTVTFIAVKLGLATGYAADFRGDLVFADLGVADVLAAVEPSMQAAAQCLELDAFRHWLEPRRPSNHKGMHGHLFLLGGFQGYSGAILLAGEAALRSGTGLVSVATWPGHSNQLNLGRPELMVRGVLDDEELLEAAGRATVAAIGPGLGREEWGKQLYEAACELDVPQVVDADALYHLAKSPNRNDRRVLTPHPGEAATLLGTTSLEIQKDRPKAVREIQKRYGGVVLLKGSGTLIATPQGELLVCTDGNPGMAVGGMGDVLTGLIASLIAQGLPLRDATCLGAIIHAQSADRLAASYGTRGILAGDLFPVLRQMVNEHQAA